MSEKEGYEVIRFVERGRIVILYRIMWKGLHCIAIQLHEKIEKAILGQWLKNRFDS